MRTLIMGLAALAIAAPAAGGGGPKPAAQSEDYNRYYDNDGYYSGPTWRGRTGAPIAAAATAPPASSSAPPPGALVGRAIDGGRNRATGTIVGGAVGAVVGREVARNRCN